MISRFLFSIVCAALAVTFSARADEVDDYVHKALARSRVPGMSIAVIKDGKVIKAKGYGLADVELNAPATENTVYQWASVTKQFTSAAILLLFQDGKVKLD